MGESLLVLGAVGESLVPCHVFCVHCLSEVGQVFMLGS